jgi:hypothetical protein
MGQIHPGLSYSEYRAPRGWNASLLKLAISKSPAHAYAAYIDKDAPPRADSAAFRIGSAVHCMLLESDQFDAQFITPPADAPRKPTDAQRNAAKPSEATLAAIAFWDDYAARAADRTELTASEYAMAVQLYGSISSHPALAAWFTGPSPLNELTLTWTDPATGAPCKGRLDAVRLLPDHIRILDLKSAAEADPPTFGRSALNYGYLLQGAFYRDGLDSCRQSLAEHLGLPPDALNDLPIVFEFIAAEKAYPWLVARYFLTEEQVQIGRDQYLRALAAVLAADATGYWPGYDHAALPLELPPWFRP